MRIRQVGAFVVLAVSLPAFAIGGTTGYAHAAPLQASCSLAGYSHNNSVCLIVPSKGTFTIKVPSTSIKLKGTGSGATKGTQITVTKVAPPHPSSGGVGIKIRATGKFNPLHVSSGKIWKFTASQNKLNSTKTITGPGIYQVTK